MRLCYRSLKRWKPSAREAADRNSLPHLPGRWHGRGACLDLVLRRDAPIAVSRSSL
jgi:hypothetical protein